MSRRGMRYRIQVCMSPPSITSIDRMLISAPSSLCNYPYIWFLAHHECRPHHRLTASLCLILDTVLLLFSFYSLYSVFFYLLCPPSFLPPPVCFWLLFFPCAILGKAVTSFVLASVPNPDSLSLSLSPLYPRLSTLCLTSFSILLLYGPLSTV